MKIDDMSCQHCVKQVETKLNGIDGIDDAVVIAALTEAGYPASLLS